ncbi:MFS sugar transporter [Asterophora parasitica]|uniref:MFS sugar transporter n=1 Tax=Asterophora parasitica TaxID=117018 RepID=A0A9P7G4I7_9AGAR|nr:MFS sugar transporter [Asterophora parasitica]
MSAESPVNEKASVHGDTKDEVRVVTEDLFTDDAVDPVYQAKARILNDAIQEIGMGRYQWGLFVVTGFGWLA